MFNGLTFYLTCHVCISQEKIPSAFIRFSKFCPNLVSIMVKEVLPDDGLPPTSTKASPEQSKVYELNFKIQNFMSSFIFQNDLWLLHNSRLNSLFASKAHVQWNLSLKNLTLCLLFLYCGMRYTLDNGRRRFSSECSIIWLDVNDF